MIGLSLVLAFCIWTAIAERDHQPQNALPNGKQRSGRSPKPNAERETGEQLADSPNEHEPAWTALDDMQIARLLRDSAP
jgi:hypothetical protein